MYHEN